MKLEILITTFVLLLFLIACNNNDLDKSFNSNVKTIDTLELPSDVTKVKNYSYHNDYLKILKYFDIPEYDTSVVQIIEQESALLIIPTNKQIEYLKNKIGNDDFYIAADDNNYYISNLILLLDSFDINVEIAKKRKITFKGLIEDYGMNLDPTQQNIDTIYWGLVLFNSIGNPIFVDIVDPDIEKLKDYMSKEKKL